MTDAPPEMFDLAGKVAIVTGSTKGIGRAIAEQMAALGARVVVSSRKTDACEQVAAEINARLDGSGGEAVGIPCHILHREQCESLVQRTIDRWGRVDILVCNAALNPFLGSLRDIPDEAFDKTIDANIKSNVWLTNLVIPGMVERRDGVILIIGSTGGLRGTENLGTYAMTKAADMQLVRNLTVEWGRHNIRSNCIAPSLVKTDMAKALWSDPVRLDIVNRSYPLQRIGEPDEVAAIAVALASRAGQWMTGQTIVVDGGMMAGSLVSEG